MQCLCFILHIFQVSPHDPGLRVCNSHFQSFSVSLTIFQVIKCAFDIFQLFHFFSIFRVLQCAFLIFHVFQCFCHIPGQRVCISHFERFSLFHTIIQVLQWAFLSFHVFHFSLHIPGPTVCIFAFPRFSFCHIPGCTGWYSQISNFVVFSAKSKS